MHKKNDVSLSKEFQKNLSKEHEKHGVIDQGEYRKRASIRKWTHIEYHVKDNADVTHKYVKIYCDTNQFTELPFCGPHSKPHGTRGLSKHHRLRFDPKLGHDICVIIRIPCACVSCTSMLDTPWISGTTFKKKHATNLSQILLTDQCLAHITIGIPFT